MAKNRGTEFQKIFEKATLDYKANGGQVEIQRLYDVIGKKTIEQPSDYICYKKPNQIFVECKSTNSSQFDFYDQPQYNRLIEKSKTDGVIAGMLVWFINEKRVFWLDINWMVSYHEVTGRKSIAVSKLLERVKIGLDGIYEIEQTTPRVKPIMNMESFYNRLTKEISYDEKYNCSE